MRNEHAGSDSEKYVYERRPMKKKVYWYNRR